MFAFVSIPFHSQQKACSGAPFTISRERRPLDASWENDNDLKDIQIYTGCGFIQPHVKIAIKNGPVEIVDFPIKHGDFPSCQIRTETKTRTHPGTVIWFRRESYGGFALTLQTWKMSSRGFVTWVWCNHRGLRADSSWFFASLKVWRKIPYQYL